ncbi:hypothetical protein B0H11DRAFT_2184402 [Mycena galericulata]|nr:hypothetical protein B0H11DRAFT_2184402 [Mycena galericulata]
MSLICPSTNINAQSLPKRERENAPWSQHSQVNELFRRTWRPKEEDVAEQHVGPRTNPWKAAMTETALGHGDCAETPRAAISHVNRFIDPVYLWRHPEHKGISQISRQREVGTRRVERLVILVVGKGLVMFWLWLWLFGFGLASENLKPGQGQTFGFGLALAWLGLSHGVWQRNQLEFGFGPDKSQARPQPKPEQAKAKPKSHGFLA